jgi:hypothetical protein
MTIDVLTLSEALALVGRQRRPGGLKFIKGVQVTSDNLFLTSVELTKDYFMFFFFKLI